MRFQAVPSCAYDSSATIFAPGPSWDVQCISGPHGVTLLMVLWCVVVLLLTVELREVGWCWQALQPKPLRNSAVVADAIDFLRRSLFLCTCDHRVVADVLGPTLYRRGISIPSGRALHFLPL